MNLAVVAVLLTLAVTLAWKIRGYLAQQEHDRLHGIILDLRVQREHHRDLYLVESRYSKHLELRVCQWRMLCADIYARTQEDAFVHVPVNWRNQYRALYDEDDVPRET